MFEEERKFYTPAEYLTLEEEADYKSEYYQGEIFALAGASANHNRIVRNLCVALSNGLEEKPCEVFISDMRLFVEREDLYTYPDLMAICGQLEFVAGRTDTITNPFILVEVLSKSTEAYDRGKKFEFYRTIETFEEYVLIDQERVHIEYFRRVGDKQWVLMVFNDLADTLRFEAIEVDVPLERIYRQVSFAEGEA